MDKWRRGLYKSANDKLADVLAANNNVYVCLRQSKSGAIAYGTASEYEKSIALEEQAAAITRLSIDAAMTK